MAKKAQKKTQKNAIDMLLEDHEKVRHLLDRLEGTSARGGKTREKLIEDIHRELEVHTALEEELFYPAMREAASDQEGEVMHFEFVEEHYLAGDVELPRTLDVDVASDEFTAHAIVLKEIVTHHIEEEEARMFPRARELFESEELIDLGAQMMARKKELMTEMKKAA